MKTVTALIATLTLLTACAPTMWTKPGFTQQDWMRERYACERDMRQSGYFGGGIMAQINAQNFFERCLEAHGYHRAAR